MSIPASGVERAVLGMDARESGLVSNEDAAHPLGGGVNAGERAPYQADAGAPDSLRRNPRSAAPSPAKPISNMAQEAGSGTPEAKLAP